jgi:hypothetical protein
MSDSERKPISEEQAHELAKVLAALLKEPLKGWAKPPSDEIITVAGLIRYGAQVFSTINQGFPEEALRETNQAFIAKTVESLHTPEALESFLYQLLLEKGSGEADDIKASIDEVERMLATPGQGPRMLKEAMAEMFPKARPGRPSEYRHGNDLARFLAHSSELYSACEKFLSVRAQFPAKSIDAILNFLDSEDPEQIGVLRSNAELIAESEQENDFTNLKRIETKARRLSDAITGKTLFKWSYIYSVERAAEFRRSQGRQAAE